MTTKSVIYCDKCGAQMTHFDGDGESVIHGYQINIPHDFVISLRKREKEKYGSNSTSASFIGRDFCSSECFDFSLKRWLGDACFAKLKDAE